MPSPSVSGSSSDMSYGCISGSDFYAEVIVGRFSGSTPAQIATQVERSIEYERYPQSGVGTEWYDNALGVASNQGPGFGGMTDDDFNEYLWNTVLSGFTYDSYQGIYDGSGGSDGNLDGPGAGGWSDRGIFHRHRDPSRAGLAHQVLMRSSAMAALAPT